MPKAPNKRIAFIASGGGMSSAYSAGVAHAMHDFNIKPDIIVGSSGSAGTVSYIACGQADFAAKLWVDEVSNPIIIRSNPTKLDVDHIVDSMKNHFPFDQKGLHEPTTDLFLATTEYKTTKTWFFSNHENLDWYEVIRASMAIPFVYGKKIKLNGKLYYDGDVSTSLSDCIKLVVEKGATHIFIVDNKFVPWEAFHKFGFKIFLNRDLFKFIKGNILKLFRRYKTKKNVQITVIKPKTPLKTGIINNKKELIKEAIASGYKDANTILSTMKI